MNDTKKFEKIFIRLWNESYEIKNFFKILLDNTDLMIGKKIFFSDNSLQDYFYGNIEKIYKTEDKIRINIYSRKIGMYFVVINKDEYEIHPKLEKEKGEFLEVRPKTNYLNSLREITTLKIYRD